MRFNLLAPVLRRSQSQPMPTHRGFTLLEVLVAIVVLSFGVLGVVGLQAAALQANKDARYQSTAVAMGRELADLMRGNKDLAAATSAASNPYLGNFPPGTSFTGAGNCFTNQCISRTEVANQNMREWLTRAQAALPGVRITTCFDATPYAGNLPQWDCTAGSGSMAVVKMGWTRQGYDRSASGPSRVSDTNSRPVVILPLIPGNLE